MTKSLQGSIAAVCLRAISIAFALAAVPAILATGTAQAQTYTVLHTFVGVDGSSAKNLILDSANNLYGTTEEGGAYDYGTVFAMDSSGNETVLYSFKGGTDGGNPLGPLTRDAAGNLYGVASGGIPACGLNLGCGVVFKIDTAGNESVLYTFTGGADGANPTGGVRRDAEGNLYGTAAWGGANNVGTLFKLDSAGNETVLYNFDPHTGANPSAGLIRDRAGNFFGTASAGGKCCGTVFKVDNLGNVSLLHNFVQGRGDGSLPLSTLVGDVQGNLYGTTGLGGAYDRGAIFKVNKSGPSSYRLMYSFTGGSDGGTFVSSLTRDTVGNLYGVTESGGTYNYGTVFKFDTTRNLTVLYNFTGGTDGGTPYGTLVQDATGNLYGSTDFGGLGYGVVFKISF